MPTLSLLILSNSHSILISIQVFPCPFLQNMCYRYPGCGCHLFIESGLCNQEMPRFNMRKIDKSHPRQAIIEESEDWLRQQLNKSYACGSPADLYNMSFKEPWVWSRFYRVSKYFDFKLPDMFSSY